MSRPITVVKEKQKKPRAFFAFVYSYRESLHVDFSFCLANHKTETQIMHPVYEAGYWIEYNPNLTYHKKPLGETG